MGAGKMPAPILGIKISTDFGGYFYVASYFSTFR